MPQHVRGEPRSATLAAVGSRLVAASPQAPERAPQQPAAAVVRVSLSLVQVDAVVTDKAGQHVTDLTAGDFEIYEDGRLQEITHCSYVALPRLATTLEQPAVTPGAPAPPPPPSRLRRAETRRTLALVVDDLGLSFRSTVEVREALRKFVDRQMEPGDLVAIVRAGGGMGALQQFTADKRLLHAAIDRVRFNSAMSRVGVDPFAPIGEGKNLVDTSTGPRGARAKAGAEVDALRESMLADATLAAVGFVINGLRELPGRKGVVLFSDGLSLYETETDRQMIQPASGGGRGRPAQAAEPGRSSQRSNTRVDDALRRLIDVANRASVVLYSVDTRGLSTLGLGAQDDVNTALGTADVSISELQGHLTQRATLNRDTGWGLQTIAQETGGFLLRNQNDLSKGIERVLEDQRGYYLIGYAPDAATFKAERNRPAFHKVKLAVKRPGLQVRSRTGFYGVVDGDAPAPAKGPVPLLVALASPFASGDVRLSLTSFFVHEPERGPVLRSVLHLDARDLSLSAADGALGTTLELLAVTFGDNGMVVDELARVQELRVPPGQLDETLREGIIYRLDVPVKHPGAYQLRVAIRDRATARFGTANQLVEVPDLGKERLALSGIVVGGLSGEAGPKATLERDAAAALRRFRPGQALAYSFAVYNARRERATGRLQLDAQMRLYRDGEPLTVGERRPIEAAAGETSAITGGGAFMLGPEMPPGDYVLQVVVTDALAGKKRATATQAIDFQVE